MVAGHGGYFATTPRGSNSLPITHFSGSRGEGLAAIGPTVPADRVAREDSGSRGTQISPDPRSRQDHPRVDERRSTATPPHPGGSGHTVQDPHPGPPRQHGVKANFKIASLNIRGRNSRDFDKWLNVPQMISDTNIDLLAVQETHLTEDLAKQFTDIFGNTLSLIHSPDPQTNNARGIALVINKKNSVPKTSPTRSSSQVEPSYPQSLGKITNPSASLLSTPPTSLAKLETSGRQYKTPSPRTRPSPPTSS